MALFVFPLKSINGSNTYSNDDFRQFYANIFSSGIIPNVSLQGNMSLQVIQSETPSMNIGVGPGVDLIFGGQVMNTAMKWFPVPAPLTTQPRTDSIVVQWSNSSNSGDIIYKTNSTQVVQTNDVWEHKLAEILVPANASSISQANITDTRADPTVCGYSSPFEKVQTGDLLAQFKSQLDANGKTFDDWFASMKGQLSTDAAGNLQLQIDKLNTSGQPIILNSVSDFNNVSNRIDLISNGGLVIANAPYTKASYFVESRNYNTSSAFQRAFHNDKTIAPVYRIKVGGVFSPWIPFVTADETGLVTVQDLKITGALTKANDIPPTLLSTKSGVPFSATIYYRVKNGILYINAYAIPTGNIGAGAVTTLATLPIELAPKAQFAGREAVFLACSDLNGGTRGATGTLIDANGNIIISSSVAQSTTSRFGFSGSYPIE